MTDLRLAWVLQRLPFTLCFTVALVVFGIVTGTHYDIIELETRRSFGYSPQQLLAGEWFRLFTSIFFTVGGWKFYAALAMFMGCVGTLEWQWGSLRAASLFLCCHVAALLSEWLLLVGPLKWLHPELVDILYVARDVGPSAGYYGCLGVILGAAKHKHTNLAIGVVFLALGLRLTWSVSDVDLWSHVLPADLAHGIAFPLGFALGKGHGPLTTADD